MHLLIPIAGAVIVAVLAKRHGSMVTFFVASLVAALLIGMEIQEGIDD